MNIESVEFDFCHGFICRPFSFEEKDGCFVLEFPLTYSQDTPNYVAKIFENIRNREHFGIKIKEANGPLHVCQICIGESVHLDVQASSVFKVTLKFRGTLRSETIEFSAKNLEPLRIATGTDCQIVMKSGDNTSYDGSRITHVTLSLFAGNPKIEGSFVCFPDEPMNVFLKSNPSFRLGYGMENISQIVNLEKIVSADPVLLPKKDPLDFDHFYVMFREE